MRDEPIKFTISPNTPKPYEPDELDELMRMIDDPQDLNEALLSVESEKWEWL